ncbi:MAG: tyrosine--tRNA ligase [Candidatus Aenigmarchaeota archaeon]|nr:tyrosine--tRNA ligase [Candidatus Aenigmarchaeota archaeon]
MDLETKLELILSPPTEEVITEEDLRQLLETKEHPVAYNGFEPSGIAHLGTGLLSAIKMNDLIEAGIHYKILLATWHAAINMKLGGDLNKLRKAGEYLKHAWIACGVDPKKVEFVFAEDLCKDLGYWELVLKLGSKVSMQRVKRALTIMGRTEDEQLPAASYIYPLMQTTDIFKLNCDICQLGIDQRRANMLAREIGLNLGLWKPVAVHHHLLIGLSGPTKMGGFEASKGFDVEISSKMAKSIPKSYISIHDSSSEIKEKIDNAFCPPKVIENNPILEICRYIIFRKNDHLGVERPSNYGGNVEFHNYEKLEGEFREGKLHPADLKNAVSKGLSDILDPVRRYFEKNREAKELFEFMKRERITR